MSFELHASLMECLLRFTATVAKSLDSTRGRIKLLENSMILSALTSHTLGCPLCTHTMPWDVHNCLNITTYETRNKQVTLRTATTVVGTIIADAWESRKTPHHPLKVGIVYDDASYVSAYISNGLRGVMYYQPRDLF